MNIFEVILAQHDYYGPHIESRTFHKSEEGARAKATELMDPSYNPILYLRGPWTAYTCEEHVGYWVGKRDWDIEINKITVED